MKSLRYLTLGLAAYCCSTPSFAAKESLRLKPTSQWQVDYATDYCRLGRQFGEGENTVLLILDKYGPGESFAMTVAGQAVRVRDNVTEALVQFGPIEDDQRLIFFKGTFGKEDALVLRGSTRIAPPTASEMKSIKDQINAIKNKRGSEPVQIIPITAEQEAAVRYFQISEPLRRTVILETGSMKAPFAALDKCIDELVTHWGVDVEKHKSLTRKAVPAENPGRWITTSDYPKAMAWDGQRALVEFRLNVGPDGKPTACYIQATTRPKEFDDAVCKSLMQRGKFEPALDAEGRPLASYWRSRVTFDLPSY
jgi:Gram-negative bacterial TonB protein C-terminal